MVVLRPEEARRLVLAIDLKDAFGSRDRAMLVLAWHTGLRVCELTGLDVSMVSLDGAPRLTLHVPGSIAKGGHGRQVPLDAAARRAVAALLAFSHRRGFSTAPEAPLLVNRRHERLTVRAVQRLLVELREKAGLDVPASRDSLRHAFGSELAARGGNLRIVQQALGHKRLDTTAACTHPTPEEVRAAVDRLCR